MLDEFEKFPNSFDKTDGFFAVGFKPLDEAFAFAEALADVIDTFLVWNHSNTPPEPSCVLDAYFRPGWQGRVIGGVDDVVVDYEGVTLSAFVHRGRPARRDS